MSLLAPPTPVEFVRNLWHKLKPDAPKADTFVLQLQEQADLSGLAKVPRGPERRQAAWDALTATQRATQPAVLGALEQLKAQGKVRDVQAFALGNTIEVAVDPKFADAFPEEIAKAGSFSLIQKLDETPRDDDKPPQDSDKLGPEPKEKLDLSTGVVRDGVAWNIRQAGIDTVWKQQGVDGSGVRVGVLDTGLAANHEAFQTAFDVADEEMPYRWAGATAKPSDPKSHGTHVSGTIAGAGGAIAVGAAPGAQLMVNGMLSDDDASAVGALEWFLAPGAPNGVRDPRRGADIVSNSWGLDNRYKHLAKMLEVPLEQLREAGILSVFAAGNEGPKRGTMSSPGDFDSVLSVAATDRRGVATDFSSRGDDHGKPDIAAPGDGVPSSIPPGAVDSSLAGVRLFNLLTGGILPGVSQMGPVKGTGGNYWTMSGTSMATPLVSGAAALLLEKYPQLEPDQVMDVLRRSAIDLGPKGRDNTYGYGRIDLPKAFDVAEQIVAGGSSKPTAS